MKKISTNNIVIRIFYLVMVLIPCAIVLAMKLVYGWELELSIKLCAFLAIVALIFFFIIRYNIFDWDFYIENNMFVFKQFNKKKVFKSTDNFIIRPIPISTMFFQSYIISFGNEEEFIFKSMPVYKIPFERSYAKNAERIKSSILSQL